MYTAIGGPREPISIGIQVNSSPYQRASKTRLAIIIVSQNNHDIENVYINISLINFNNLHYITPLVTFYFLLFHSKIPPSLSMIFTIDCIVLNCMFF